jgi:hypothetical protein
MPDLTRRQLALLALAALTLSTLVIGVYGLLVRPSREPTARADSASGPVVVIASESPDPSEPAEHDPNTTALPRTNDATAYARATASALFDWDSASGYVPADYQTAIIADADPSGEETPGLITDAATYFPTLDQWLDLATMNVTQKLRIAKAEIPADWARIVGQAHGELRPGTTAVTIIGRRIRTGTWHGQRSTSSTPVAFTVFVACAPTFDRCHLLRLSELDNPLR